MLRVCARKMVPYFACSIYMISILCAALDSTAASKCVPYERDSRLGAIVVDSCPKEYSGDALVIKKCSTTNDLSDPLMADLVTNPSTKLTYQNLHCAACNNAPLEDLLFWSVLLDCKSHRPLTYETIENIKGTNKWGLMSHHKIRKCDLSFEKPVYVKVEKCKVMSETARKSKPFSFALLLDVNRSDGDIVGESRIPDPCKSGEKYDPFFHKCRKLVCAIPGYEMVDNKCKKLKKG
ncbi:hypothetical protein JTE90_025781 [Oedothorax gibbosus]|uniref:Uncharacterized protein n=1 Tax=Oedothorax gibbosus TaxID=931172 RepID=A0AAV6V1B0_9ARAC|nr:hypothetical protein JTE90_025781 [Oedothorax gibbosus]